MEVMTSEVGLILTFDFSPPPPPPPPHPITRNISPFLSVPCGNFSYAITLLLLDVLT